MKGPEGGRHAQASMICATKYLSSLVSFLTIGAILIESLGCKGQAIFSSSPKNLTGTCIKGWAEQSSYMGLRSAAQPQKQQKPGI